MAATARRCYLARMIVIATQCFPPVFGGIETYMSGLAEALADSGQEIAVFADGSGAGWDWEQGYPIRRFRGLKPLRAALKRSSLGAALRQAEQRLRPVERIFLDSWKSLETAAPALKGLDRRPRLVTLAHGMEFPARPSAAKRSRVKRALGAADAILANSPYTAERVAPYLAPGAPIQVATPPIPPQEAASAAARARMRERLGLAEGAGPLIAALARLEPRKGFDHLIGAAAAMALLHPGLKLAIASDGPDRQRLASIARDLDAPAHFLGRITDAEKAALFAEADLFAMPTRIEGDSVEGYGIAYLEAAWHGAPALAGRAGGAAAAVLEGKTGWLCDGASAASVAETLGAILSDRAELERRGAEAAQHARAQLWSVRLADYLRA